jgi:hypothetical protein
MLRLSSTTAANSGAHDYRSNPINGRHRQQHSRLKDEATKVADIELGETVYYSKDIVYMTAVNAGWSSSTPNLNDANASDEDILPGRHDRQNRILRTTEVTIEN